MNNVPPFRKANTTQTKHNGIGSRQTSKQQHQRQVKMRLGSGGDNHIIINNNIQQQQQQQQRFKGFGIQGKKKLKLKVKLNNNNNNNNNNNGVIIHQPNVTNDNNNNNNRINSDQNKQQQLVIEQHKIMLCKNRIYLKNLDNPINFVPNKKMKLKNENPYLNINNNHNGVICFKPNLIPSKQPDIKGGKPQQRPGSSIPALYINNDNNNINHKAFKDINNQESSTTTDPKYYIMKINNNNNNNNKLLPKGLHKLKLLPRNNNNNNNPLSSSQVKTHSQSPSLIKDSGIYYTKNYRDKMEDTYDYNINFYTDSKITASYFAVFDGCGGDKISQYLKQNYQSILLSHLKANNFNVKLSFEKSFKAIDTTLYELEQKENKLKDSQTQYLANFETSASTAVVILIINNVLYSANIGDSPCFYIDNNQIKKLSLEHNTSNAKEVERVRKQGANVFNKRVFGALSLTRCIGGFDYKEYGVNTEPHIQKVMIKESGREVAVIGSDGLIEKMNEFELKTLIRENRDMSAQEYSEMLVKEAVNKGASDNITCIVVKLGK